ncbi:MAG: two pore domain potassium channel family protein [Thermoleophilaceae bacterium]|nr:two pore domain potassium channel family protein [Thermoleophilaceae bacterium]
MGRFRYGLVCAVTLGLTVFALLVGEGRAARAAEVVLAGLTLLVSLATSRGPAGRRSAGAALLALALAAGCAAIVAARIPSAVAFACVALLAAATVATIVGGLLRLVLERGVTVQAVLGALAVYLLVGLAFAFLVGTVAAAVHGPYFAQGTDATQSERVYYSLSTLTTTGFGDLTAGLRGGRALAVLESLTGQLYLVTVIALLIGNLRRPPR